MFNFRKKIKYPHKVADVVVLAPEMFANSEETVISWRGENFYKACNALVIENEAGGANYCVKRIDHPSHQHEDYDGNVLPLPRS